MEKSTKKTALRAFLLATISALSFAFALSIFANGPLRTNYTSQHHYYISRGLPIAWSGSSSIHKPVPFPLVKAPFLPQKQVSENNAVVKVIDLTLFVPIVLFTLVSFTPFTFVLVKIKETFHFLLFIACISLLFFYFLWFPRV